MPTFRELEAERITLEEAKKARKEEAKKMRIAEKARKGETEKGKKKLKQSQEEREASSGHRSQTPNFVNLKRNLVAEVEMEIYLEDDQSELALSHATIGGFRKLQEGGKHADELLGGYFTVLCTVSPEILELGKKFAKSLGFSLKEIKVPSEHTEANVVEKSNTYVTGADNFLIAQLIYLPFLKNLEYHEPFWKKMASEARMKLDDELFVLLPKEKVHVIYSILKLSGFWYQLCDCLYDLLQQFLTRQRTGSLAVLIRMVAKFTTPSILVQKAYVLKKKKMRAIEN